MKSALVPSVLLTCFGWLAACSSAETTPPSTPSTPDGGVAFDAAASTAPVTWTPCPLHTEDSGSIISGKMAECATIKTPLEASNPNGPTIDTFVKRYRPGKSARAVWFLQGGPGASGHVFENLSEQIATKFPDVDYYMPDHRGTGRSTRLGCPVQESPTSEASIFITPGEWPACLEAVKASDGSRLAAFNTTNAANDLGVMIARARVADQPTFVYGVSYGTYWAHRYAQLYPHQVDGIVFDSNAPTGTALSQQDADANEAAQDFFGVCAKDPLCGGKLGADPWAKAVALVAKLKAGHCPDIKPTEIPTHVLFRRAFGQLLMDPFLRQYIPAIVYRADRCEPRDVAALKVLVKELTKEQPESEEYKLWGWVLSNNILMSEMFGTPAPTAAELEAIREGAVASRDVTEAFGIHIGKWPTYTPDAYASSWADTDMPMLFLQGGLDPATLMRKARVLKDRFNKPNQHWVEIPSATHTVIASSPTPEKRSCGTRIFMNFIENPKGDLDTSCVPTVLPVTFNGRTDYNQALFGVDDMWE